MARNFSDKTFTKILRGYSPEEVKEYIQYIDNEYKKLERVSADNVRKLALALRKLDEMNNYAEQLEKQLEEQSLQMENSDKVQIDYEELAKLKAETLEKANRDAESIIADAREKSINIIAEARVQGEAVVTEAEELARSVRDKILTEAASKAESIIKEAQARTEETRRSAETMGAAAMKMYGEVLSFRDTLFEAYNIHIESIEEIIETADELFGDKKRLRQKQVTLSLRKASLNLLLRRKTSRMMSFSELWISVNTAKCLSLLKKKQVNSDWICLSSERSLTSFPCPRRQVLWKTISLLSVKGRLLSMALISKKQMILRL